eukprot:2957148-Pleurochrysis_carterae.AAC.2
MIVCNQLQNSNRRHLSREADLIYLCSGRLYHRIIVRPRERAPAAWLPWLDQRGMLSRKEVVSAVGQAVVTGGGAALFAYLCVDWFTTWPGRNARALVGEPATVSSESANARMYAENIQELLKEIESKSFRQKIEAAYDGAVRIHEKAFSSSRSNGPSAP